MTGRVGFGGQLTVELRKLVDTPGTRWTLGAGVLVLMVTIASAVFGDGMALVAEVLAATGLTLALVMGIVGILAVTGESRHRTAIIYLPISAGRSQLYFATFAAGLIAAVALQALTVTVVFVVAAVAPGLAFGAAAELGWAIAMSFLMVVMATAFAMGVAAVLRNFLAAAGVVVAMTLAWNGLLLALVPDLAGYLGTVTALGWLESEQRPSVVEGVCSLLLWYVGPCLLGWRLALRVDVA